MVVFESGGTLPCLLCFSQQRQLGISQTSLEEARLSIGPRRPAFNTRTGVLTTVR